MNTTVKVLLLSYCDDHIDATLLRHHGITLQIGMERPDKLSELDPHEYDFVILGARQNMLSGAGRLPQALRDRSLVVTTNMTSPEVISPFQKLGYEYFGDAAAVTDWLLNGCGVKV